MWKRRMRDNGRSLDGRSGGRAVGRSVGLALVLGLASGPLAAQGERITIRTIPAPNQTIRIVISQELAFDVSAEGLPNPIKMEGRTRLSGTQRTGAPDSLGRITAELTFQEVDMELLMNGSPMPVGAMLDSLKGRIVTVMLDPDGKVVSVTLPPQLEQQAPTRAMIANLLGSIPTLTLAVGDTVTVRQSVPLPMDLPGASPGSAVELESRTTHKLVGIEREGSERIARLDQVIEGTLNQAIEMAGPSGPIPVTLDLRMNGTGTTRINLDHAFIASGQAESLMDMTIGMGAVGTMQMRGQVRMVVSGTREP